MIKKLGTITIFIFLFQSAAHAETLYLKNGNKIQGKIIERGSDSVKIEISGIPITYYMDEIERIEGGAPDANAPSSDTTTETVDTSTQNEPSALPTEPARLTDPSALQAQPTDPLQSGPLPPTPGRPPLPEAIAPSQMPPQNTPIDNSLSSLNKKELILKFIEVYGTRQNMETMFAQIIAEAPPEKTSQLRQVLNVNDVIERLIPIYDKYFTDNDLKELISFYKNQTGRKLIQVMPMIMEDTMQASMKYFEEKMPPEIPPTPQNSNPDLSPESNPSSSPIPSP